jgi:hypothetical protein
MRGKVFVALDSNHLIEDQIGIELSWLRVLPFDLQKIPWRDYPLTAGYMGKNYLV